MYTKEEISRQKQAFWTAFGRYMQPALSADGEQVSWINYKTGVSGIQFKMDVDRSQAEIAIVLLHSNPELQQMHYSHFVQLRGMLNSTLGEEDWNWQAAAPDAHGKIVSTISKVLPGVNIHRQEDWGAIISFLKPRIIALDEFWSMAKYGFEALG